MSRRNRLFHLGDPHTCGNFDCKLYGKRTYKSGKCARCSQEKISWEEFEWYEKQFGDQTAADTPSQAQIPGIASYVKVASTPPNDTFTCPATLTGCPVAEPPELRVPHDMYLRWVYLCRQFETEWIAYLQGKQLDKNRYEITGMTFPQQEANGVHVSVADDEKTPEGTIAAVHSHVDMSAFFSEEDAKHFNHKFELVVNRRGEVEANGLSVLDCGRLHRGKARVLLVGAPDQQALRDELRAKLTVAKSHVNGVAAGKTIGEVFQSGL